MARLNNLIAALGPDGKARAALIANPTQFPDQILFVLNQIKEEQEAPTQDATVIGCDLSELVDVVFDDGEKYPKMNCVFDSETFKWQVSVLCPSGGWRIAIHPYLPEAITQVLQNVRKVP